MRNRRDSQMRVDVFIHNEDGGTNDPAIARIESKLDQALAGIESVHEQGEHQVADLSALQAEVSENTDAVNSASALLTSLAQQIRDAADDPAELQALADQLDANNQALAQAVSDNTTP